MKKVVIKSMVDIRKECKEWEYIGPYSQFLEEALNDLKKCEKKKDYVIDMSYWFQQSNDVCYVCLAGATMAGFLGFPKPLNNDKIYMSPSFFHDNKLYSALMTLDQIRLGHFLKSYIHDFITLECYRELTNTYSYKDTIHEYKLNKQQIQRFYKYIEDVIKIMRKHGC